MLFDKQLFESKYVKPEKRVPIDTLFLIGNGFDIWEGFNTRYADFEKYYEEHLDEVLLRLKIPKRNLVNKDGNKITCSDVELFYGNPYEPQKLPHNFWCDFEASLDKIDDQEINHFFGREGVKNIKICANNAQKILREIFCDWIASIKITEEKPKYNFGENALFINFNYTDTLIKRFGVRAVNEYHIHGSSADKNSIIFGHSSHPELPYETLRMFKNKPRFQGLYHIEEFLYNSDKHIEDNYMKLRVFCALHGVRIEDIKKIYVLGLGFGDADLGYIKNLIYTTEGISEDSESELDLEELFYLTSRGESLNIGYAISHRERVMKKEPISFPEAEKLEEIIKIFLDDPYHELPRNKQIKIEKAAVRKRYLREQEERNKKIQKEYLRMLNKNLHLGYITPKEAFLEVDEETIKKLNGAEWHISYFSNEDKEKIEKSMSNFRCKNYILYNSIDECIKKFKLNS